MMTMVIIPILQNTQERTSEDSSETDTFKQLMTNSTHEYAEEVLSPHFGAMISFVKEAEAAIERGKGDELSQMERKHYTRSLAVNLQDKLMFGILFCPSCKRLRIVQSSPFTSVWYIVKCSAVCHSYW